MLMWGRKYLVISGEFLVWKGIIDAGSKSNDWIALYLRWEEEEGNTKEFAQCDYLRYVREDCHED